MSADLPVAGLILAGFHGQDADAEDVVALCTLGVGGFIVFGRNVVSPPQVHALLAGLRARRGDRPTLYALDQEGGRVARLRAPLTVWPPMGALGQAGDARLAWDVGAGLGAEIAALGFNLNFAPTLDVNSHAENPVIGDRAFGSEAATVLRVGIPMLEGLQSSGVAACAKHFPGHGHVDQDSHEVLPTCPLDGGALAAHLSPFRAAVQAGVASVMTAHVVYPAIDPDAPATLSSRWIAGILRGDLGFAGVVFTDDLEMGAILAHGGIGAAAVRAVRAGVDGLLVCARQDRVREVVEALAVEARRDPEFAQRCIESLGRLRALSAAWPPRPVAASLLGAHLGVHGDVAARVRESATDSSSDALDPTAPRPEPPLV